MPQLLRVVMSRDGSDPDHEELHEVTGIISEEPHVGDPVQIWRDDGKVMHTSNVKRIMRSGSEWIVETRNSLYRMLLTPARAPSGA